MTPGKCKIHTETVHRSVFVGVGGLGRRQVGGTLGFLRVACGTVVVATHSMDLSKPTELCNIE